jgi:hypothetical protein
MTLRDLHWVYPAWAALLGALGGWAFKWLRRYLLPISGGLLALAYGIERRRCVGYAVATTMAFSLPYSPDRHSWGLIFLVGAAYGATPLILCWRARWAWWPILTGSSLAGLMAASLHLDWFTWKWAEMLIFGLHGFLVSWTIDRRRDA